MTTEDVDEVHARWHGRGLNTHDEERCGSIVTELVVAVSVVAIPVGNGKDDSEIPLLF